VIILIPALLVENLLAQNTPPASIDQLKSVIPPSPDASSLGKYASWPVNLYTGLPTIDIPIYELKGRSITIPISLDYHASGIKVSETASLVGLGWSLNAGGVITRSVLGLPDDDPNGYLSIRQSYNDPSNMGSGTVINNQDSTYVVQAGEGLADGQPDNFMFNALGRSYRFFFAGNGKIVTQPYSNLQITVNWLNNTWQVITEDGTILNFGGNSAMEVVNSAYYSGGSGGNTTNVNSSWFLTSIVTPAGETVSFSYTSLALTQHEGFTQTDYLPNSGTTASPTPGYGMGYRTGIATCGCSTPAPNNDMGNTPPKTSTVLQTTNTYVLSSIQTDLGRVDFFLDGTQRLDLQGGYALDSVKVFNKLSGSYIRKFVLSHSYTTAASSNTSDAAAPSSYARYRLHLDSLTELSTDQTLSKKWKFLYNPQRLPAQTSFAQDHLGYFNGAVGNTTFLPMILTGQALYCAGFGPPNYTSGDRSFHGAYMGAESLYEIVYPTGGYTVFNMEPNNYPAMQDQLAPATINDPLLLGYQTPHPFTNVHSDTFRITRPQFVELQSSAIFSQSIKNDFGPTTTIGTIKIIEIGGESNSTVATQNFNQSTGSLDTWYFLKDAGTYVLTLSLSIIDSSYFNSSADYADLLGTLNYTQSQGVQPAQVAVGGLRLKSQFEYDNLNNSAPAIRRYYQYASPLVINPIDTVNAYLTTDQWEEGVRGAGIDGSGCIFTKSCWQYYLVRNSNTKSSLGSVQGGPIGYGQVTELQDSAGVLGYTVYNYFNQDNDIGTGYAFNFPFVPVTSTDWQRGLLLQKTTFNSNNQPLTREVNTYSFPQRSMIQGFKSGTNIHLVEIALQASDMTRINYPVLTQQVQKVTTQEIIYNPSTGDSLMKSYTFFYDDTANMQPVRTLYFGSRGDSVLVYSRTALEKPAINSSIPLNAGASTAIDSMIAKNMVGPVLETEEYRKSGLVKKTLLNYRLINNNEPFPDNVMIQNGTGPMERRINFFAYDSSANLIEEGKAGDVRHDYLYDYKSTYPVAECVGGDSADIAYTSFEADGTGNWTLSGGSVNTGAGLTGHNSYNLRGTIAKSGLNTVSTYIVSYWSQGGSMGIAGTITGYPQKGKTITINGISWTFFVHKVSGQSTITVSGIATIDELRLYPVTARMTSYTYNPLMGMTSQTDVGNRTTYYEYDGLARLKRVRDQDYNILKTLDYQYQAPAGCGSGCSILAMQTFAGSATISYPVGVFGIHGNLLGNAINADDYVSKWNTDTADNRIGTLSKGADSMHFNLALNTGQAPPAGVTGCRYYQVDLAWNRIDAVREINGSYITFGDGTGMRMNPNPVDSPLTVAPNTSVFLYHDFAHFFNTFYIIHDYPDTSLKTITCYHNDGVEDEDFDNDYNPATSLMRLTNLRGYLPLQTTYMGGSCYQQPGMTSLAQIADWNAIHTIQYFRLNNGDNSNSCLNISYPQDFMQNNRGLLAIDLQWARTRRGNGDTTFHVSRLKSDWNTWFTQLEELEISEDDWNHEDLSGLLHLRTFELFATTQNHTNDPNSPLVPLSPTVLDNALIQIAAGAGRQVSNGSMLLQTGGSNRTAASDAAYNLLVGKGWTIIIDTTTR